MSGKVWKYITEKLASDGACHFSLLDPDPLGTSIENVVKQAKLVEKAGSDAVMIGGSTIFGVIDDAVAQIGEALNNEAPFEFLAISLSETLVQDPRITEVYGLNFIGSSDSLQQEFKFDTITRPAVVYREGI